MSERLFQIEARLWGFYDKDPEGKVGRLYVDWLTAADRVHARNCVDISAVRNLFVRAAYMNLVASRS